MGMSQMCTGAGDYFRTSKPHSEKLCEVKLVFCLILLCSTVALAQTQTKLLHNYSNIFT